MYTVGKNSFGDVGKTIFTSSINEMILKFRFVDFISTYCCISALTMRLYVAMTKIDRKMFVYICDVKL